MQHQQYADMYYDHPAGRSPTSVRQSSLHRQNSRQQFEPAYGHLPSGLYTAEDHAQSFNGNPRFNANDMRNATVGGYGNGGYDNMGGQSWNAGAFGQNNTLNGLGGPNLRKPPSRGGRSGLPSVCCAIKKKKEPRAGQPLTHDRIGLDGSTAAAHAHEPIRCRRLWRANGTTRHPLGAR